MADTVQYIMEEMVPELEDLEKREIFSKKEIKQIVKKRTHFEYLLKRRAALKTDYLRYIEYERQVDTLRRHRKKMQGDDAVHGTADTAGIRRIHFVFSRSLRKFRGDLSLWTKYFAFCRNTDSTRSLDKALTQALQLHPHVAGLWAYAASWELEKRSNVEGARALMMRGLRNCKQSERLWQEYFKLELVYAARLRQRREVLGLAAIQDAETDAETEDQSAAGKRAQKALLSGAVARVAFKKAVEAMPHSLEFRLGFLHALGGFEGFGDVLADVLASLERDFASSPDFWQARAQWASGQAALKGDEDPTGAALEVYAAGLAAVPTGAMHQHYINFLWEQRSEAEGDAEAAALGVRLRAAYTAAQCGEARSGALSAGHAMVLVELGERDRAREVLAEHCTRDARDAVVWRARLSLVDTTVDATNGELSAIVDLCSQAVGGVRPEEAEAVWAQVLGVYAVLKLPPARLLRQLEGMLARSTRSLGPVTALVVDWLAVCESVDAARLFYSKAVGLPGPSLELFQSSIRLERAVAMSAVAQGGSLDMTRLRPLLTAALEAYGQSEGGLWLQLAQCEREAGGNREGKVYWQATKTLQDPADFVAAYKQMA